MKKLTKQESEELRIFCNKAPVYWCGANNWKLPDKKDPTKFKNQIPIHDRFEKLPAIIEKLFTKTEIYWIKDCLGAHLYGRKEQKRRNFDRHMSDLLKEKGISKRTWNYE